MLFNKKMVSTMKMHDVAFNLNPPSLGLYDVVVATT
jgi:hypothetical protein